MNVLRMTKIIESIHSNLWLWLCALRQFGWCCCCTLRVHVLPKDGLGPLTAQYRTQGVECPSSSRGPKRSCPCFCCQGTFLASQTRKQCSISSFTGICNPIVVVNGKGSKRPSPPPRGQMRPYDPFIRQIPYMFTVCQFCLTPW